MLTPIMHNPPQFWKKRMRLPVPGILAACAGLWIVAWPVSARADPGQPPPVAAPSPPSPALQQLGADFVSKIGTNLDEADLYLKGAGKLELAERKAQTEVPDNEPLLLHAIIGKAQVGGGQDIYSVKRDHRLLISLGDFSIATGLAITVKPADGTASGFFVRQTQTFSLDAKKGEVVIQGKAAKVSAADVQMDGNDLLVSAALLEQWFGLTFDYDFAGLNLFIASKQSLPAEEAYLRSQKKGNYNSGDNRPSLPYQETPYALLSQPYIDTNINALATRSPNTPTQKTANFSTIMNGDVAGFNGQAFLNGSKDKPYLNTARITLGKQDVNGGLLGPLHATQYQFGDVNTVPLNLVGSSGQEQGVSVTSQPLNNLTNKTSIPIRGNAQAGWDVELYRNNSYIDIRHVDAGGIYDFGTVDLILGDNDFKFLFYGPQGEVREEHRHVGVDPNALANAANYYALSATRENTVTWDRVRNTAPGTGSPHVVGAYDYNIPGFGSANIGIRTANDLGVDRTFAEGGLSTYRYNTFLNADVGVDAQTAAASAILTARRNFGNQSGLVQYSANAPNFNAVSPIVGAGTRQTVRTGLSGPLANKFAYLSNINYNLDGTYSQLYNGETLFGGDGTLNARIDRVILSGGVIYNEQHTVTQPATTLANIVGITPSTVTTPSVVRNSVANASLRGFAYGGLWRVSGQYEFLPVQQLVQTDVEYDHPIGQNVDTTADISYAPNPSITTAALSVNWRTSKATISPTLRVDTARNITAGVNVHFAVGADPYSHSYTVMNAYLTGTGGVAARIFMDKNGNGFFDAGDTLLPDVTLTAVQQQRSVVSNKDGIAFIPDLAQNQLTDVMIDPSGSQDAYGVSMFKGVSIRPHPGAVVQLDFPIVEGGEMDGQAGYEGSDGAQDPGRGVTISLVTPDGRVEQTTLAAGDGYWSISGIRPGVYYLTAATDHADPGFAAPRLFEFRPDGTTLFGQSVILASGQNVKFNFTADNAVPDGPRHTRVVSASDIERQRMTLAFGGFHSRLAITLALYKFRIRQPQLSARFDVLTPILKITPDVKTGLFTLVLKPKQAVTLAQAATDCAAMDAISPACTVNVATRYTPYIQRDTDSQPFAVPQNVKSVAAPPKKPRVLPKSVNVMADFEDYANRNPSAARVALTDHTAILNLGSYNSREMMIVVWYKIKKSYASVIGNARLMVQPADDLESARTGKHTLRAVVHTADLQTAADSCTRLNQAGITCSVEVAPDGRQASIPAGTMGTPEKEVSAPDAGGSVNY